MRLAALAFLLFAVAGPSAAAPVPKQAGKLPENADKDKLQGKWKLVGLRLGGQDIGGAPGGQELVLEFAGDSFTASATQQRTTGKVKFDEVEGVKRMTMVDAQKQVPNGPPAREEDVSFGYVLDRDKLLIAVSPGAMGKVAFADPAKPGKDTIVMTLARVKDDPAPGK